MNDGVRCSTRNSADPRADRQDTDRISAPAGETAVQPFGFMGHNGSPDGNPDPAEL